MNNFKKQCINGKDAIRLLADVKISNYNAENKDRISNNRKISNKVKIANDDVYKQLLILRGQEYYLKNREKILLKYKERVLCGICGSSIIKYFLKKHQTSKKCQSFLSI